MIFRGFLFFGICQVWCVLAAAVPAKSPAAFSELPAAAEQSPRYAHSYNGHDDTYDQRYDNGYSAPYVTGSCYGQYPGMTGDVEYDCRSYSVCQADGRLDVLQCPPYTRFNNYLGVCDWHFKVDNYCNPLYREEHTSRSSYEEISHGQEEHGPSFYNVYSKLH